MQFFLGIVGVLLGFSFVKYREAIGNAVGEPAWAAKVGGIYNVMIFVGVFFFFWGIATFTGTTDVLLSPIQSIFGSWNASKPKPGF